MESEKERVGRSIRRRNRKKVALRIRKKARERIEEGRSIAWHQKV